MLRDLSLDYFPNFFNIFTSRCVSDLKENYSKTKIVQNTKKKKRSSEHLAHSNSTRISWVRAN